MSSGLAILVKTPMLSPIKTRLARGVGQMCAEAFHLTSAEAVASVAQQASPHLELTAYWAVAESKAMNSEAWVDLARLPQGEGTLGERMAQVYRLLLRRHNIALLVGADTPQITESMLASAIAWLSSDSPRLVIGRAEDGGFWLFGGNCRLPDSAWNLTTYSTEFTSDQFAAAMRPHGAWLELEELSDVDQAEDLELVNQRLKQLTSPTDAQLRLAQWLDEVIAVRAFCNANPDCLEQKMRSGNNHADDIRKFFI